MLIFTHFKIYILAFIHIFPVDFSVLRHFIKICFQKIRKINLSKFLFFALKIKIYSWQKIKYLNKFRFKTNSIIKFKFKFIYCLIFRQEVKNRFFLWILNYISIETWNYNLFKYSIMIGYQYYVISDITSNYVPL